MNLVDVAKTALALLQWGLQNWFGRLPDAFVDAGESANLLILGLVLCVVAAMMRRAHRPRKAAHVSGLPQTQAHAGTLATAR
jgi:hypothetical protein